MLGAAPQGGAGSEPAAEGLLQRAKPHLLVPGTRMLPFLLSMGFFQYTLRTAVLMS
jgi:hypothetical protein